MLGRLIFRTFIVNRPSYVSARNFSERRVAVRGARVNRWQNNSIPVQTARGLSLPRDLRFRRRSSFVTFKAADASPYLRTRKCTPMRSPPFSRSARFERAT